MAVSFARGPECDDDYVSSESENEEEADIITNRYALDPENAPVYKGKSIYEKELEFQLFKRMKIMEEMRKAYLRDVVAVKYIMNEVLEESERRKVFDEWKDTVPSADLKDTLLLRSPFHGALAVTPCKRCGGTIEVVFSDIQKVKDLQVRVDALANRNELMRLMVATLEANIETTTSSSTEESRNHAEEKKYLYAEIKRLKTDMEETAEKSRLTAEMNKKFKDENLKHISNHQDLSIRALANEKALERALELNTELKNTVVGLRVEIHAYQTGNMDLEAKICVLDDRLKVKDDELLQRKHIIDELNIDHDELKAQVEKQREFSKKAENAVDIADRAKETMMEENRKLQVVIEKHIQANEVLEDKVESLREEVRGAVADLDASRAVLLTTQDDRDMKKMLVAELESKLLQQKAEVSKWSAAYKELESKASNEISALSEELIELSTDFASKEERLIASRDAKRVQLEALTQPSVELKSDEKEIVVDAHVYMETAVETEVGIEIPPDSELTSGSPAVKASLKSYKLSPPTGRSPNKTAMLANISSKDAKGNSERIRPLTSPSAPIEQSSLLPVDINPYSQEIETAPDSPQDISSAAKPKYVPKTRRNSIVRQTKTSTIPRTEFEFVTVLEPIDPASVEEERMRESVLQLVTENLDETLAKKVLNALTPWLGEKSKALEAALKMASDAIASGREAVKGQSVVKDFISGVVVGSAQGKAMTPADVNAILSKVLHHSSRPTDLIGPPLQVMSNEEEQRGEDIAEEVLGTSDDAVTSNDFPGELEAIRLETPVQTSQPIVIDTLDDLISIQRELLPSLQAEIDSSNAVFHGGIVVLAREWAEAKKVALTLDDRIEAAKQSLRDELEPIINDQSESMKRISTRLETELASKKLLITKYTEITNEVNKLKPRSDRLFESEDRLRFLQKEHDAMEITSREIKLKYSQVLDSYKELEALYEEKQKHLEERTTHLDEHRRHVNTLRQSISQQDAEHMILQQTVNQLMDREDRRLNALKTVECQCDPETATVGIQTEFFIPAMSLAIGKQRHRLKLPKAGESKVSPADLMGPLSEQYMIDRKALEFEKALETLRLGPNQTFAATTNATLSAFSTALCEEAISDSRSMSRVGLRSGSRGSRRSSGSLALKPLSLSASLPRLDKDN